MVTRRRSSPASWFWAGVIAFVVILAVEGFTVVRHGNARIFGTAQIATDILIAAAFVCVGAFFRWAVLRERLESSDK
jgi:hypothetical protein